MKATMPNTILNPQTHQLNNTASKAIIMYNRAKQTQGYK
jgi:hypothetical protein